MTVVLYRPSLDARSGAGQLLATQWRGLTAVGVPTLLACERGALKFWWRTGVRARRCSSAVLARLKEEGATVLDHGLAFSSADISFVHNLAAEASRYVPAPSARAIKAEREYFQSLSASALIVANSKLVAGALREHFGLEPERVAVLYPGFDSLRYTPQRAAELRSVARAELGVNGKVAVVGFVTSGDFEKRGLDLFLDCASRITAARPNVRFLVAGSKQLPSEARAHVLVRDGVVLYRPKSRHPERWMAALDLFLYAARFEEYGMVLAEAQAMGVPVLTSRLVGASECLPEAYSPWLLDRPEPRLLAERALALLENADERRRLVSAALLTVGAFDGRAYDAGTRRLLADQKRRVR